MKVDYRTYITSDRWRQNHRAWLKVANNRCAMLPWVRVGSVKGKYHPYNIHHMSYRRLGQERYWLDVVALCPFAHDFIIHGILSGFKPPSKQRSYPNRGQRIVHAWCRMPTIAKIGSIAAIALLFVTL